MAAGIDSIDYCNEMSQRHQGFKNSHSKKLHLPTDSCKCTTHEIMGAQNFIFPQISPKFRVFSPKLAFFGGKNCRQQESFVIIF